MITNFVHEDDILKHNRQAATLAQPSGQLISPNVLIAEHRDEVFARLAADVCGIGYRVFRATRASEIPGMFIHSSTTIAICNSELPESSGWLTATKLRMYRSGARIWLYAQRRSASDAGWARMSGVEQMIYYQGDLFQLADQVTHNLQSRFASGAHAARRNG